MRRRRRLLYWFAACAAAGWLLVALLPWWLGGALRLLPAQWGVSYGSYHRTGYSRFELRDVKFKRAGTEVTVTRVEADTPVLWWWRRGRPEAREIVADRWTVTVGPSSAPPAAKATTPGGWVPLRARLARIASQLDRWLPRARVGEGQVRWPTGELKLASATWEKRTLAAKGLMFRGLETDATAKWAANGDVQVDANTRDGEAGLALSGRGAEIAGDITWWRQRAELNAAFRETGWLPAQARLRAADWSIPGAKLRLENAYATVRGQALIEWTGQAFRAEVTASGQPLAEKKAPPLELGFHGHGDATAFTIDALRAMLPGATAELSAPVTVERGGRIRETMARFAVRADLGQLPWFSGEGQVQGEAQVVPAPGAVPRVDFSLVAREVKAQDLALGAAEVRGRLEWPRITVSSATITGREGERLEAHGGGDFRTREVLAAGVRGQIKRATLARWLPAQPQFDALMLDARATGSLADLQHTGEVQVEHMSFPGVKPLQVAAQWAGRGKTLDRLAARASAGGTTLAIEGAVEPDTLRLASLTLAKGDAQLQLTAPAAIRWRPALRVESLHLRGGDTAADVDLTWGEAGQAAVAVRNFSSAWLGDLVALRGPAWQLGTVALAGNWDHGPMTFSAAFGAMVDLGDGRRAAVNLAARGDKAGVQLEALRATEGAESVVNATGRLPVTLSPGQPSPLTIDAEAPLVIDAVTAPNAAFWQQLAALSGLELKEPNATAHVRGTWRRPEGDIRLQVARIAVDEQRVRRPLPTVEALDIAVRGDRGGVTLETLSLQVEGQAVRGSGRLAVGEADWAKLFREPLAFARRGAELKLEIPDADLAAFARMLPAVLAPKGRLHLDAAYRGGEMDGNLRLSGAATRPLGPLGVVQEIEADVRLAGQAVEIRSVKAQSGGEEVRLTGRVELPALDLDPAAAKSAEDREPRFDLELKGQNLPFVRSTGLLVRGDLDLKLTTTERGNERVTGTVRLRDSLFLQDVRALLPGGAASKSRRPPYFAVENPPLDAWRLDVTVEGDQFMRLRTTLFNGVASARFHLGGTLGDPIAFGEAIIDEGRVRLPFANFDVQEGRVTLSRENPYEPQLWVAATARRYGYDLRMEVTGGASAPVLALSSSPPLEHGQVLLMVMAGQAPKQEVTYTDQQRATRLGTYLGQSLLAGLGDSENAERLSISSGEKVSRQGRETYDIEYQLSDKWSLTGEYDEFDDYNAGVKWRVYSREGKKAEEAKHETRR